VPEHQQLQRFSPHRCISLVKFHYRLQLSKRTIPMELDLADASSNILETKDLGAGSRSLEYGSKLKFPICLLHHSNFSNDSVDKVGGSHVEGRIPYLDSACSGADDFGIFVNK